jgi:hypothetical protein
MAGLRRPERAAKQYLAQVVDTAVEWMRCGKKLLIAKSI